MIALVITTVDSKSSAEKIAEALLKDRLAACVSMLPATSMYRRQGRLSKDDENVLMIKTSEKKLNEMLRRLKEIHPYELPEILILRVEASDEYQKRVEESTQ